SRTDPAPARRKTPANPRSPRQSPTTALTHPDTHLLPNPSPPQFPRLGTLHCRNSGKGDGARGDLRVLLIQAKEPQTRQRSEYRIRRIHKNGSDDNRARRAHPPRSMNRTPFGVMASTRKIASAITPPRDGDQAALVTNPTSRPSFDTRSPWTGARSPSARRPSSFRRTWPT